MNYLSHAFRFLDQPEFAMGTQVPDFLNMVDRKVRARRKLARQYVQHDDPFLAKLAAGVVQHHDDDHDFHGSLVFTRLNHQLADFLRQQRPDERGMRSWFVGHIAVEMLLDWSLSSRFPELRDDLYDIYRETDPAKLRLAIEQITGKSAPRVEKMHAVFLRERFLYDYDTDDGILYRINRIVERVGLEPHDAADTFLMAEARRLVDNHWQALLEDLQPPPALALITNDDNASQP